MALPEATDTVRAVVEELERRNLSLACAESLTGGALTATFVAVPGVSAVLRGGVTTYATDAKASVLGVPADQLKETGPVDRDVAIQMARGACRLLTADVALATTGVAGPGPAEGREAGTVWVACAGGLGEEAELLHVVGSRAEVRQAAIDAAVQILARRLNLGA